MNELSFRHMLDMLHLLEAAPVEGMLPAQALASMLPDVTNVQMFTTALVKIERGETGSLLLLEIRELANAFISLIQLPAETKMQVIEKMMPVQQGQASQ